MNKFFNYIFALTAIAALGFMSSCSDDDETPTIEGAPTVSIIGDPDPNFKDQAGKAISFTVKAEAPLGFNVFRVNKSIDGSNDLSYSIEINRNDDEYTGNNVLSYPFSYTLQGSEIGKDVVFTFQVVDDEENQDKLEVKLVTEAPAEESVAVYSAFLLVPPAGDKSTKTFFSSTDGKTYTVNEINGANPISPSIDFGYYYGENDKASLSAPENFPAKVFDLKAQGWSQYNETVFRPTGLSVSDFEEITVYDKAALASAFELGDGESKGTITNLAVDKIYAFTTDDSKVGGSKFGLIRVKSIKEGAGINDGIDLEVKVEK